MSKIINPAGNCYQSAFYGLWENREKQDWQDVRLVHGFPRLARDTPDHPAGTTYGHAWVEYRHAVNGLTWAWDTEMDATLPQQFYYDLGRICPDECHYYDWVQASAQAVEHGHFGCWQPREGAVFAS